MENTTANGCTFACDGGTCKVRGGDALPVELMGFSVENAGGGTSVEEAEDGDDT